MESAFWELFFLSGTIFEYKDHFVLGAGERKWTKEAKDGQYNFYFPDFFLQNPHPFFYQENIQIIPQEDLAKILEKFLPISRPLHWTTPDAFGYQLRYERLYEILESHFFKKAVLYALKRAESDVLKEGRIPAILNTAIKNKKKAFLYGFWDAHEGMVGVSPEILFEKNSEGIFLEAVAGTQVNSPFSKKEENEHQIVIDGIQEALFPWGTIRSFPKVEREYSTLHHLSTPLKLETDKKVSFLDLINSLHPTPSLGTYPKDRGLPWLKEIDAAIPRGRYGAPAGFMDKNHSNGKCVVAIRNIQWKEGLITMAAGGGVTLQSQWNKEWEEILYKFDAIQRVLGI